MSKGMGWGAGLGALAGYALTPFTGGLSAVASTALGASLGSSAGAAVEQATKKTPAPPPVVPLPDPEMQQQAKRREILRRRAGSGRASTIFTEDGGTPLGG